MGLYREVSVEGGSGPLSLGKVLLRGSTSGVAIWGGDLSAVGSNCEETSWSECGIPTEGDKDEGKNSEG